MNNDKGRFLEAAKSGRHALGRKHLMAYLEHGATLSKGAAISAKCYECQGYYIDGVMDCQNSSCAIYLYHPYNPNKTRMKATRVLSEQEKQARAARMETARSARKKSIAVI